MSEGGTVVEDTQAHRHTGRQASEAKGYLLPPSMWRKLIETVTRSFIGEFGGVFTVNDSINGNLLFYLTTFCVFYMDED